MSNSDLLKKSNQLRLNRITIIRLVCAYVVLLSHLDWMSGHPTDPLRRLGLYSVAVFFGLSGYLLSGSIQKSGRNNLNFLSNRILRIFPGYFCVLIVTSFIFAPFLQYLKSDGNSNYFTFDNLRYVLFNASTRIVQVDINNSLSTAVIQNWNPSLWTLKYEIGCYLILFGSFSLFGNLIFRQMKYILITSIITYLTLNHFMLNNFELKMFFYFLSFFALGCWIYSRSRYLSFKIFILALIILFFSLQIPRQNQISYFDARDFAVGLVAIPIFLYLAFVPTTKKVIKNDYSFGIYIYAGPLNHLILQVFPEIHNDWWIYAVTVVGATSGFAFISWHFVEKPFLRLKLRTVKNLNY